MRLAAVNNTDTMRLAAVNTTDPMRLAAVNNTDTMRLAAVNNTDPMKKRMSVVTLQTLASAALYLTASRLCWCLASSWSAVRIWSTYRQTERNQELAGCFLFWNPSYIRCGAKPHGITRCNCIVLN
jgi:hypothetical protein